MTQAHAASGPLTMLTGWGRTAPTAARVRTVVSAEEVVEALRQPGGRGVLARGLARSYGDAAQNAGGLVLDMRSLDRRLDLDSDAGTVSVDAGLSLHTLLAFLVPQGWFIGVTSGTRYVTVGGAIASDVHGKNHHADGGFCQWVERFTLATPTGIVEVDPHSEPEVFWATAGGMGLTGVVTRATLRLLPISSTKMIVRTQRAADLDQALALLSADRHRYSVAWIDLLATGAHTGRSVVSGAEHAGAGELTQPTDLRTYAPKARWSAPPFVPAGVLSLPTVRVFNEAWFRNAGRSNEALQSLSAFFHPLDGVKGWNRMYGPGGFVQYQFAVPTGAEQVLRAAVTALSRAQVPGFLAVLKRLGAQPGLLSFPIEGWTLTLDLPAATPDLAALLDWLDDRVAQAGGRVYLTKDARMRPEHLPTMYPALDRWREVRDRLDPDGHMKSDLGRRLGLSPPGKGSHGH